MPDFTLEQEILAAWPTAVIAGVDEAGRGPWAGPVIAGAAVLNARRLPASLRDGLDDSKKLSPARRERLFAELESSTAVAYGWGAADVAEIDRCNILRATDLAMQRAVAALPLPVDHCLVDGNRRPPLPGRITAVVKGDGLSLSIAAASIVAKVTRDRMMIRLAAEFPGYGWASNMGYGTAEHQAALARFGITPHHRKSFAPIRKILSES
jgi:ribonuclease HII